MCSLNRIMPDGFNWDASVAFAALRSARLSKRKSVAASQRIPTGLDPQVG
jgi:hypothetical protein